MTSELAGKDLRLPNDRTFRRLNQNNRTNRQVKTVHEKL